MLPNTSTPVGGDCFYQYEVFDKGGAPGTYFGDKVLAVSYGGTLYLRGQKGIRDPQSTGIPVGNNPSDSGTSWVRLASTITKDQVGSTSFYVDRPVPTWGAGDQIVLTSTDYLPGHSEELIISGVSSDSTGTKITVSTPIQYPHWGEAYDYSKLSSAVGPQDDPNRPATQQSRHLENRAAVALLTRSILIESEGTTPVLQDRQTGPNDPHYPLSAGFYGGHTMVRDGFAEYQVQGVEFANLGQGGEIGHYPVHFHMARTVPQPNPPSTPSFAGTYLVDSSVHDSNTRFVTLHATQGVIVARNVGFRSIGHGYYLEDATEINNKLYSNIGIQANAAVKSDQNPRNVPGIFSRPGDSEAEVPPYHSDYDHPSVFWIMNTWNDFQYNVAVGAGTCGVCYWMPPASNSGYSVYETWSSYASMQTTSQPGQPSPLAGGVPLMNFVGNSCSAAMTALQATGISSPCKGVLAPDATTDPTKLQAITNHAPALVQTDYPNITDERAKATICNPNDPTKNDCSYLNVNPCAGAGPSLANCAATVIDHFSTSFNWAQFNFASVLLRGWWYLLSNSSITDVQNGGLSMVTGGGYSRSDVSQGFWNLSSHNLFAGNTQPIIPTANDGGVPDNPFASNAGPFNPYALSTDCPYSPNGPLFCVSPSQGIAFENANFSNSQRLIDIYDGPTFEDSDAFFDIHTLNIGSLSSCRGPGAASQTTGSSCGNGLTWMNGYNSGVLQSSGSSKSNPNCILPNAAISWKQPNGFYYPPAFFSRNLYFDPSVDIRHFVIDPLWLPGTFNADTTTAMNTYCSWNAGDFGNFTDVDRQTELTDLDGSLTGLLEGNAANNNPTISVNNDPTGSNTFFNAPVITAECQSNAPGLTSTVNTSPYEYVTTAIYPACSPLGGNCGANWAAACTTQACAGVPLYRQYLTDAEMQTWSANSTDYTSSYPSIRMMGQDTGQRSSLTMNHVAYYVDTTIPAGLQSANANVFVASQTYLLLRTLRGSVAPPGLQHVRRNRALEQRRYRGGQDRRRQSLWRERGHLQPRLRLRYELLGLDYFEDLQFDHWNSFGHHRSWPAGFCLRPRDAKLLPAGQLL